jgi:alcohol dehydrogenase YqhD (iron-dependent ADH family)
MLDFTYAVSTKVLFGKGMVDRLSQEIKKYANRILFVYGGGSIKKIGVYDTVKRILEKGDIEYVELCGVQPNPRIDTVRTGIRLCRDHRLDFVLGVGGGSVIDSAKTIAAGVFYEKDPWDFFLLGDATIQGALPIGTVLTFTGTGSEMNGNAVITNMETQQKLAIHNDVLRPRFSILDPTYTFTVPKEQTAAGTVDIFSHVLEQYFSPTRDVFLQDRLAESILKTCIRYSPVVLTEPANYSARAQLMWASSMALNGILGYGRITDWATHGIEHAVSATYDVTHGIGLAILTPPWMEHVLNKETMYKFVDYAHNVWSVQGKNDGDTAKKAIEHTREFFTGLGTVGNFQRLGKRDVLSILKQAY